MSGYFGYSMSNNAVSAYRNGKKPLSKWTKKAILEALEEECEHGNVPNEALDLAKGMTVKELKEKVLECTEWHHTSKFYNRTDFYSVDEEKVLNLLGVRQVLFWNTPDGEKAGDWEDCWKDTGCFRRFKAEDKTIYNVEDVSFSRFEFLKVED